MINLRIHLFNIYVNICDYFDFLKIPYHSVIKHDDDTVSDITKRSKIMKHYKILRNGSDIYHTESKYQVHTKHTDQIYIINTTLHNLMENNKLFPQIVMKKPRKYLLTPYEIKLNNELLTLDEKILLRKHDNENLLIDVFVFMNKSIDILIIYENDNIIEHFDDVESLKIADISKYL